MSQTSSFQRGWHRHCWASNEGLQGQTLAWAASPGQHPEHPRANTSGRALFSGCCLFILGIIFFHLLLSSSSSSFLFDSHLTQAGASRARERLNGAVYN